MRVASVVVVDDQALFRSGLARLLDEDRRIKIVGEAGDGAEALAVVADLRPDVVLLDLRLPDAGGAEITAEILKRFPETKVLILTAFEIESYVVEALSAGAHGYVLKDSTPASIASSIVAVLDGKRVLSGAIADRVLEMLVSGAKRRDTFDGLTAREIEILKLLAQGLGNKQIAAKLNIMPKTVRNHISNTYEKLHVEDRSQAVIYAMRKGLVEI